ncbi:class I SAM-dependent methyltransferase [Rhodospira trueperi]|uniref:class I SAM-dependent methyltransferase n=1 Tax=Rhodospira trueperi TaxID=69960 RepID=UPI001FE002DF|nr:50S ribosomal protein L11 methyltransferase [Rhodospira trueperi]
MPEVRLHLATEITPLWQASEDLLRKTGVPPPFWAFAWPGSQALARYVLDHPDTVRGRTVLDFAAGCGVAGLAAARAGAASVTCVDIDPMALEAVTMNAALNGLGGTVATACADLTSDESGGGEGAWGVILAGDVCYEKPMAERVTRFLTRQARADALVLLADPGRAYLTREGMETVARFAVPTTLELEDRTLRETTVLRLLRPSNREQEGA